MSNVRQHLANALEGLVIVRSETHVEIERLRLRSEDVEFSSLEEESAYEAADLKLAAQIEAAIQECFPGVTLQDLLFTDYDWWPSRSCGVTLYAQGVSTSSLAKLQGLLVGEYSNWRISVHVAESPETENEVGTLFLTRDRAVVQRSVFELAQRVA